MALMFGRSQNVPLQLHMPTVHVSTPNSAYLDTEQRRGLPIAQTTMLAMGAHEPIIGDDSHFIADELASFLSEMDTTETPFFAYIALHTVHKPFIAIPPYSTMYENQGYTQKEIDYYGSITAMDEAIGNIRELLSHHNLSEKTMLWFASDNGPEKKTPGQASEV